VSEKPRILLTDGHYKHVLGLARHLKADGWDVWCIGNPYSENRFSRFFTYIPFVQGSVNTDIKYLRELLNRHQFNILLPIGASSVNFFSEHESFFSEYTNLIVSKRKNITDAFDKLVMAELAQTLGIKSPTTFTANNWKYKEAFVDKKFIVKSRNEFINGPKTLYFSSRVEGENFLDSIDEKTLDNLIVQERIYGDGEAFFALYNQGKLLTGYTHRRIRETPLSGGSSTCAETTISFDTFNSGKQILDRLKWHGVAMVEFKRDSHSRELYLMEVNPKFWGSLELGISHGVDFSGAIHAIDKDVEFVEIEQRTMVRFQWPFHGDLSHLKVLALWKPIVKDLINYKVKKNIYFSDPFPILLRPVFIVVKFLAGLKVFKSLKTCYFRLRKQGIKVAFLRQVEESTGIPVSRTINLHGKFILGPQISAFGKATLKIRGVRSSANLQSEFHDVAHNLDFENHLHVPCREYHSLTDEQLLAGVKFLHKQVEQSRTTYIHCREGVSRAPYLLIAYYVSLGYSVDKALGFISKHRSFVNPLDIHLDSIKANTKILRDDI
jgi:predicted ATP-grasp superfamily ATP-dependent carboligase